MTSASNDDWKAALVAAFPVARGGVTLSSLGLVAGPAGPRASMRLVVEEDGVIVWEVEQELGLAGVGPEGIATWAERARERLAGLDALAACTTPSALFVPPFRPLVRPVAAGDPGALETWLPAITDGLREQALTEGYDQRFERLALWPTVPRTVYFLDLAYAMLGGNGLEVFLAQACFEDVVGVLAALEEADCERLALRMRQGIGLAAAEGGSEFMMEVDEDWPVEHGRPLPQGEGRDWERIDSHAPGGTWWLVDEELAPALARYVVAHLDALVG